MSNASVHYICVLIATPFLPVFSYYPLQRLHYIGVHTLFLFVLASSIIFVPLTFNDTDIFISIFYKKTEIFCYPKATEVTNITDSFET